MKVTLIRPPAIFSPSSFNSGGTLPPIGLVSLATFLRSHQHDVQVIDAHGENLNHFAKLERYNVILNGIEVADIIDKIDPKTEVIGISCMFSVEWFYCDYLIREIKRRFPRAHLVVGGEHITAEWHNVMRVAPEIDYCILGEGEESFHDLLDCLTQKKALHMVPGIVFREADKVVRNPNRKRIKKLDEMPPPDWDMIPIQNYLTRSYSMTALNNRSLPILASRGCPFTCKFCTSPQMWGTDLNLRSPDLVIEEIKRNYEKYKVEHFDFIDIVGVLNPKWTHELLTKLAALNLPVTWLHGAGTRSEILTTEILDLFKASKAMRIFYAPESGSKATLIKIRKRVNLDKMTVAMRYTKKLGISMRAPLIYGFPEQTLGQVFESIWFGLKLVIIGVDDIVVHPFSAHPGSEYYRELVEKKILNVDQMIRSNQYFDFLSGEFHIKVSGARSWSEHIPSWSLPILQIGSMGLFYAFQFLIRPQNLFKSFYRALFKKKPLTLFDHVIYHFLVSKKNHFDMKSISTAPYTHRDTSHCLDIGTIQNLLSS